MATSRIPGPLISPAGMCVAARSPGVLGYQDQGDLGLSRLLGDTPGPLGWYDAGGLAPPPLLGLLRRTPDGKLSIPGGTRQFQPSPTAAPQPTELSWIQIKEDMQEHEALILHLYLDSRDKVTVGIGNMLPALASAKLLGFVVRAGGAAATADQIEADWDAINKHAGKNYAAKSFAKYTLLDLPETICWNLLKTRIDNEFLPAALRIFPKWETFPTPAKRALLDMVYNLGEAGLNKFKKLIAHVELGEWEQAAQQCKRGGIPDDRNEWTAERLREAAPPAGTAK